MDSGSSIDKGHGRAETLSADPVKSLEEPATEKSNQSELAEAITVLPSTLNRPNTLYFIPSKPSEIKKQHLEVPTGESRHSTSSDGYSSEYSQSIGGPPHSPSGSDNENNHLFAREVTYSPLSWSSIPELEYYSLPALFNEGTKNSKSRPRRALDVLGQSLDPRQYFKRHSAKTSSALSTRSQGRKSRERVRSLGGGGGGGAFRSLSTRARDSAKGAVHKGVGVVADRRRHRVAVSIEVVPGTFRNIDGPPIRTISLDEARRRPSLTRCDWDVGVERRMMHGDARPLGNYVPSTDLVRVLSGGSSEITLWSDFIDAYRSGSGDV
ncbi:hypothetical protein K470DRAFT_267930 [Piedraia hortae CBS 480.64]|uniref:Uncharacterized protein n=1 Tax=Piedraia hortae CBS 480.64 TaxID=1314780 RepID=A0A6A7C936_9PEZI|nr:hypothetical protein K470DRAFT_267930 [Piedraia hortae CBS 480.64]